MNFFSELFFNPQKRVFIWYLLSASLIGIFWLIIYQKKTVSNSFKEIFSRKIWFSYSARSDYSLLVINKAIMAFISPVLISQVVIATFWFELLHQWSIPDSADDWPKWLIMSLFTFSLFLLDDASKYLLHRCLHKSQILWRFHRVHHSATTLTPLTIFRTHPVEGILFVLRSAIIQGVCIGVFVFFFGSQLDLISVLGLNLLIFVFNVLGANLRHSNVPIHYPKSVERWLMSPAQHHIHHSTEQRHFDRNFGVVLTVWDRLGDSFHHSETNKKLCFGVVENDELLQQSVLKIYLMPFVDVFKILSNQLTCLSDYFLVFNKKEKSQKIPDRAVPK